MKFELLPDKVAWTNLSNDEFVFINDMFYCVVQNYPNLGGGRMLMLRYHTHVDPKAYKFHQVGTNDGKTEVFHKID